jgi:hypothetical protein
MADYTIWPTEGDVIELLDVMPSLVDSVAKKKLVQLLAPIVVAAVTAQIAKETHRTFVLTRDEDGVAVEETRYFDGSGTGIQEVDEMVSLSEVTLVGWSGVTPATVSNVYLETDVTFPSTRLAVNQGGLPGAALYLAAFPKGRKNVGVTGVWGYASTVPADLWLAHLQECCARVAADVIFNPSGRKKSFSVADAISETYLVQLPGEASGWHARFTERVCHYTSPKVSVVRNSRPVMI